MAKAPWLQCDSQTVGGEDGSCNGFVTANPVELPTGRRQRCFVFANGHGQGEKARGCVEA